MKFKKPNFDECLKQISKFRKIIKTKKFDKNVSLKTKKSLAKQIDKINKILGNK